MKTKYAADGRRYTESGKQIPLTLDEAMGYRDSRSTYDTSDPTEYALKLNSMNMVDLQAHAIKVGIKPNVERARLIYRLKEEHRKSMSSYLSVVDNKPDSMPKASRDIVKAIMGV